MSKRSFAVLGAVGALLVTAAGCGGGNGGSAATGASSSSVAEATKIVQSASTRPSQISVTQPVGKTIPTGKKITFISCGVEACALQGPILAEGAKMLGWTVKQVGTDGSPEKVQNAFEAALRDGSDAIIINAANKDALSKQLAEAKAKGVAFVTCCSLAEQGKDVAYNTATAQQNTQIGKILAAKIVSDSKGKANSLYVNISAYQILGAVGTTFQSESKRLCPTCSVASIDIPLTSLGKDAPDRIVSYLRSHSNVNYVALSVADALGPGLTAALQAAGLSNRVKIVGQGGNQLIYQDLKAGKIAGLTPTDLYAYDYLMLDGLARKFAGVPVLHTAPPYWLMTSQNMPQIKSPIFPVIQDYKAQWAKVWGKA
jgi:ABC-type sugar transport system substrate-binding protein